MAHPIRSITLRILSDSSGTPSRTIENIPWYPGITILDAMLIADGMFADTFTFTLTYTSEYGAWLNAVDGKSNSNSEFWLFVVNGKQADEGVSSFVIDKPLNETPVALDLVFTTFQNGSHPTLRS